MTTQAKMRWEFWGNNLNLMSEELERTDFGAENSQQ